MMRYLVIIIFALSLVNCGSAKRTKVASKKPSIANTEPDYARVNPKAYSIIDNAKKFKGVRYKYGGTSKKGIDCSGLIATAYLKEDIPLPRTTKDLSKTGDWVDLKNVLPGDLMFFATKKNSRTVNHVAIVTEAKFGHVEFIHSTTSRGVITSTLEDKYWYFAFVQARRVL